jgi:hypothetical protein
MWPRTIQLAEMLFCFQLFDYTAFIYDKNILYLQFYVLFFLGALGVLGG